MGGPGSGRKSSGPGMKSYWSRFTPEERSAEMKRRRKIGRQKWLAKQGLKSARAESPFPPSIRDKVSLRNLVNDLESVVTILRNLFEL